MSSKCAVPSKLGLCPLLAIDANAFNHGGTLEFAAICAVARRHNDMSRVRRASALWHRIRSGNADRRMAFIR